MRVVLNKSVALGPRTGIGHYTAELLRCLRSLTDAVHVFPRGWLRGLSRHCLRAKGSGKPAQSSGNSSPLRRYARNWLRGCSRLLAGACFRLHCARHRYDLYHEPNYIPLPSSLPTVATVCDLSVLTHPEWHPADRAAYFDKHFQRAMANCRHIIAISEFCRREIIETLGIPPERVTCTHLGIRRSLGPLPRDQVQAVLHHLGLPANYLLYVGTIEPRKNLRTLLEAYTALPASLRNQSPLLLVGGWGWNAGDVAQFLGAAGRQRGIIHLGYLAEEHLAAVYNGARALVYPSLYEGFGLPPLEMMACGGAVLASTAGAVAEVVGGQAHLIAPEDVDAWRAALSRVVRDGDWWRSLRQGAMTVAQRYSWERCAAETLHIYQRVCGKVPEMPALRRAG